MKRKIEKLGHSQEFTPLLSYTPLSGGKRLRPYLIYLFSEPLGVSKEIYLELGTAVELFHSGSLVQDDLPSLDNDDYRRGKPALHKLYGEGRALLAADYLMLYSGKIISSISLPAKLIVELMELWNETALEVIEGEFLDISISKGRPEEVEKIHRLKTASLFGFCFSSPYVCAGEVRKAISMKSAGIDFGRAFQIFDDIKDKVGSIATLGKTPGKDESQGRPSALRYMEIEEAKEYARKLYTEAIKKIEFIEARKALLEILSMIEKY
ncbi:hypothetical protein IX53_04125 [Kosmotoga pacifica]|uniref:Polyprenyl synthetase n=1 Tax=Kosmotoga pacifica TaxID=1330330 RepID=A0A0G2Z9L3_9BACT|nr:hypothetical protein IX53_04125 [Kosmotoga pacifica]